MSDDSLYFILVNSCLVNNIVLGSLLGVCPVLGASDKFGSAVRMGLAVIAAMLLSSACAFVLNGVLVAAGLEYLRLIAYIAVIATSFQVVEMALKRHNPGLHAMLGIYLPLMVTNCAILGLALLQTSKGYNLLQCLVYALGSGAGFMLVLILMSGLREHLALNEVPRFARGSGLVLILAGILSLAFMGFAGFGN